MTTHRREALGALVVLALPLAAGCGEVPVAPRIPELARVPPLPVGVLEGAAAAGARFRVRAQGVRVPAGRGAELELRRVEGVVGMGRGGRLEWLGGEGEGVLGMGGGGGGSVRGVAVTVRVERDRRWRARVAAEGVSLRELRGWVGGMGGVGGVGAVGGLSAVGGFLAGARLPASTTISGVAEVWGRERVAGAAVQRLDLAAGESRISARGRAEVVAGAAADGGPDLRLAGVLVEAAPLRGADWRGVGWVRGEGWARGGVEVRGEVVGGGGVGSAGAGAAGADSSGAGASAAASHLAFEGKMRLLPEVLLDLAVRGAPVRLADTVFDLAVRLRGRPDSLAVAGGVGLRGLAEVRGVVAGRVSLTEGALALQVTADSVPLSALPWPAGVVAGVEGQMGGALEVGGTVRAPAVRGRVEVGPAALRLRPLGARIDSVRGVVRLEGDLLVADSVTARLAGGTLRAEGSVRGLGAAAEIEAALAGEGLHFAQERGVDLTLSAELGLVGSGQGLRLSGRLHDLRGWIRADLFRERGALDLDDPPYAELARAVPWPEGSRLRRSRGRAAPPVRGEVVVEITPEVQVEGADSELFGAGRIRVSADSAGWHTRGFLALEGGHYAFFGQRFDISGGAVHFDGEALAPRIALLAEHEAGGELGGGLQETTTSPARFPPLTYFLSGPAASARGRLLHPSLVPERSEQLAEQLMYGLRPNPVTGWWQSRRWLADRPGAPLNHRSLAQAAPLLWSYFANEGYGLVPLTRGWLSAGNLEVGSAWPTRLVVGPVLGLGAAPGRHLELMVTQPLVGGVLPGVRLRRRLGAGGAVELFSEPRFGPGALRDVLGPGFTVRRKMGVGARWRWEW